MAINPDFEAAKCATNAGNTVRAEAIYRKIIDGKNSTNDIAQAAFELSNLLGKRKRLGEAMGLAKKANTLHPKIEYDTAAFRLEKEIGKAKKDLDAKVDSLKRDLKTNDADPEKIKKNHMDLAEAYLEGDVPNKAVEHYHEARRLIEAAIEESKAEESKQAEGEENGEQKKEKTDSENIAALKKALAELLCKLGQCHEETKEKAYDKAIELYQLALDQGNKNKPDTSIIKLLAWGFYKKREFKKARDEFERIRDINFTLRRDKYTEEDIDIQKNIAWCNYELNKRSTAEKDFDKLIAIYRKVYKKERLDIVNAYMLFGWFYYDYGCHEKKEGYFNKAMRKFNKAITLQKKALGEKDKKVQDAENWLKEIPEAKKKNKKRFMMRYFE